MLRKTAPNQRQLLTILALQYMRSAGLIADMSNKLTFDASTGIQRLFRGYRIRKLPIEYRAVCVEYHRSLFAVSYTHLTLPTKA